MGARVMYQIVGRYMDGTEVVGYHLQSMETGKAGRYSREQVAYLVGRSQVTNCQGQIYKDKLLLRGIGMSLDDLPVKQENGGLTRTDNIGKVRSNTSTEDAMTQFMVVKSIVNGRNVIGYTIRNAGGAERNISRNKMIELAQSGRIGNVRFQTSNGKAILRGVGISLNELPSITAEQAGIKV